MSYQIGQQITLSCEFALASSGAPVDPTTVVAYVLAPGSTPTELVVRHDGLGRYSATYTPTVAGRHAYKFFGSGAVVSADERAFTVAPSAFP